MKSLGKKSAIRRGRKSAIRRAIASAMRRVRKVKVGEDKEVERICSEEVDRFFLCKEEVSEPKEEIERLL